MYHGIIQESHWTRPGSYLRRKIEQYQLDKVISSRPHLAAALRRRARRAGDPTRVRRADAECRRARADARRSRGCSTRRRRSSSRISAIANGWWRDTAQQLLVLKQDKSVVPALQTMVRSSDNLLARFHALWTLEGLGALDAGARARADEGCQPAHAGPGDPRQRDALQGGRQVVRRRLRALTKDRTPTSSSRRC